MEELIENHKGHKTQKSHNHVHRTAEQTKSSKEKRLGFIASLTILYMFIEIGVGFRAGSLALVSDAIHMLGDFLGLLTAFVATRLSRKPSTTSMNFGWQRAETVAALINAVFLIGLCFDLAIRSVQRLISPEQLEVPLLVLIVGSIGLGINVFGIVLIHSGGHGHTHGDSKKPQDLNLCAAMLHLVSDALGSVAVIISAALSQWVRVEVSSSVSSGSALTENPAWVAYVDPSASLLISILCIVSVLPLVKKSAALLLHETPSHVHLDRLQQSISRLEGVQGLHEFHTWPLSNDCVIGTLHVDLSYNADFETVSRKIVKRGHRAGIHSLTVQPEFRDEENDDTACLLSCADTCAATRCCPKKSA